MCPSVALFDSVTAAAIPASAPAVAGYVNGYYAWTPADWARFPTPYKVRISVRPDQVAHVLDVEYGDASPDQAPAWVALAQSAGIRVPTLYVSRLGTWPATELACRGLRVNWWVADQGDTIGTGTPHLVPGSVATQWIDHGPTDESVADLAWLQSLDGGGPVPVPTMTVAVAIRPTPSGKGYTIFQSDGGVFAYGDAQFHGSIPGLFPPVKLNGPIVDADVTPDGGGYWLLGSDGGVFAFGNAQFAGAL